MDGSGQRRLDAGEHELSDGAVVSAAITSCTNTSNPAVMLGAGIPLLIMGSKRRRIFKAAEKEAALARRLTPSFGRTRGGAWTGGLSFRF